MIYILLNLIGFSIMFLDKKFAIHGMRRVPEKTIFSIAFLGSALGVLLGMIVFRHKTRKSSFRVFIPLMLIFNVVFLLII